MFEIIGAISGLHIADESLADLAWQTKRWKPLYDQLFDIKEAMIAAELTLESWRHKFDIQEHRPVIYMRVLFGTQGNERIEAISRTINGTTRAIRSAIDTMISQPLKVQAITTQHEHLHSASGKELLRDCIKRIQEKPSWSRKFVLSMLGQAEGIQVSIDRLHHWITVLERNSEYFLEKEHPDIFAGIKRLPGRKNILKLGDGQMDKAQSKLLEALAARKDADLLHRASGKASQVHIGLSVPQIHKRDFAFLLNLDGRAHEILVRPVKIKTVNDPTRVQADLASAVKTLINKRHNACYMLPSSSTSAGFEIKMPPTPLLSGLKYKDSVSTIIGDQNTHLGSQRLYSRDQSALASSVVQGSFRLIGSQWLDFLDCTNVRWRRTTEGSCTCMLMAKPGVSPMTRSLRQCIAVHLETRDKHDLSKHSQIFRIGLVLAEIVLKAHVSCIEHDSASNSMKKYVVRGEEMDATEVASEVERRGNVFLGNMVFFCLRALQDRSVMADRGIESTFFKEVMKDAENLDVLVREDKKRGISPVGSIGRIGGGSSTPRSARSVGGYYF